MGVIIMERILKMLDGVTDIRQQGKIKHKMKDIITIVFFATIANANEWTEIQAFAEMNEDFLKKYLELPNGIPSHDTIQRVMAIVPSVFLQSLQQAWNEMLSVGEGEKLKKILAIDGKTMRGNGNVNQNPLHVVSAVATEHGLCLGQTAVKMKENEIVAIPVLLRELNIKNTVVTIDAMGTQTEIAKQIISQKGDYVLALKGNQNTLYQDVKDYFSDKEFVDGCNYYKTVEKARSQIEVREYWQTDDISWLSQKAKWKGLKTIGMTKNTIEKDNVTTVETRYFIGSIGVDAKEFARCVRGHWKVESFHWHLDVTFREDANHTLERQGALNLNIMRKWALVVLKQLEVRKTKTSMKLKRYYVCANPAKFLEQMLLL